MRRARLTGSTSPPSTSTFSRSDCRCGSPMLEKMAFQCDGVILRNWMRCSISRSRSAAGSRRVRLSIRCRQPPLHSDRNSEVLPRSAASVLACA
jgi:hypothetical protein